MCGQRGSRGNIYSIENMEAEPDVTWMEDVLYPERRGGTYFNVMPRDIINETLLRTEGDELLALCDDPRFAPSCTDAFWRKKLEQFTIPEWDKPIANPRQSYVSYHTHQRYCLQPGLAYNPSKCLVEAAYKGDLSRVSGILQRNPKGYYLGSAVALYYAALHQDWDIVNVILSYDEQPTDDIPFAVVGAVLSGNIDAMYAYSRQLKPKTTRDMGRLYTTIITAAAASGNLDMFRAVLQILPKVLEDDIYWTIAMTALVHGNYNIIDYMNQLDPRIYVVSVMRTAELLKGPEHAARMMTGLPEISYFTFSDKLCKQFNAYVPGIRVYSFPSNDSLTEIGPDPVCKNPW